jgi:hypothetical protein
LQFECSCSNCIDEVHHLRGPLVHGLEPERRVPASHGPRGKVFSVSVLQLMPMTLVPRAETDTLQW